MSRSQPAQRHVSVTAAQEADAFALAIARVAADNKTEDVVVLDLRGLSNLADYFVLGTGTSDRQMRAVLGAIADYARTVGRSPFNTSDAAGSVWMLADYVDVVVHLFDDEHRDYYDIDGLWGDAPRLEWSPADEDGPPAADLGTSTIAPENN